MKTKKILVEFESVKVVEILLDFGEDLATYQSRFLSIKNHERETSEILEVRNFYRSNHVLVVILLDDEEDTESGLHAAKDWADQFGTILRSDIMDAWILNDSYMDGVHANLDNDWYVYDKH